MAACALFLNYLNIFKLLTYVLSPPFLNIAAERYF